MISLIDMRVNPFKNYPEFNLIWPDREDAPEADVIDYLEGRQPHDKKFLICKGTEVVGMTGFWPLDGKDGGRMALAWTGVVPSHRGENIWAEAFKLVLERLPKTTQWLVEPMPEERVEELGPLYHKMGFFNTGVVMDHPELYDKVNWIEFVYEVRHDS
jgi:hypothetical protein